MGQGGVTETELMPSLLVDYTEPGGSKLKNGKGSFPQLRRKAHGGNRCIVGG
jgi:hypothetical protein